MIWKGKGKIIYCDICLIIFKKEIFIVTLQQIKDILTIAREGSITKASHVLFRAQPNLSSMVHEVESELHITIFMDEG